MPAAHWKGHISFGLVSIPVSLYPAKNREAELPFHQIDKSNHARIRYERINSETGKKVAWENIMKGYEYDKDTVIPVPDEVLKKVAGSKSKSIEIDGFISKKNLNMLTLENVYYLVPDKSGQKGYAILREALNQTEKVGIAKVIISTKEYLAAILPDGNALMLCLLKYDDEMKKPDAFDLPSANAKLKPREIKMASDLIKSMTIKWQPKKYVDEYKKSVHQWLNETAKHLPHKKSKEKHMKIHASANMIDLLKKSLQTQAKKTYKPHRAVKKAKSHHHRRAMH